MLEFQEKKRLRNILYSKVTLFAIFILLIFVARATISVYYKQKASGENLAKVKEEAAGLEKRKKTLVSEIDRLSTDKGAEEEIRKKFLVGKAGEQVIVIVDDDKINKDETVGNIGKKSFFSKFLDFFR
ncbi:MAG: septum formation initiator family protein [Patescibacteria group bacterium]|nr:septum formation initiator family protein [Patescibacteria group bacterium]MDE1988467.1 septum formation initiator family protein [Patescibacteria group bacterium]MDE2218336.1 septum formation initiator family protein [Patescibacteria group bacterium]